MVYAELIIRLDGDDPVDALWDAITQNGLCYICEHNHLHVTIVYPESDENDQPQKVFH